MNFNELEHFSHLLGLFTLLSAVPALAMKIEIDKGNYACAGDSMTVTVTDNTLPPSASISVVVEAFDELGNPLDRETITNFTQIPDPFGVDQIFRGGALPLLDSGSPTNGNGVLEGIFAGTATATYAADPNMPLTATAEFCKPTELDGTVFGTLNGISWNATISGSIDYDAGVGTVVIGPTPDDTLCKGMEVFSGTGTFAGTMASIVQGKAQGPGELTRGNFTRGMSVHDSRSCRTIEYEHVVSYGGSGNVITAVLTLRGDIDLIDPNLSVEHPSWSQLFTPDGANIVLSQTQLVRLVDPNGTVVQTIRHTGAGTIVPDPAGLEPLPPLAERQVRLVDEISVVCDTDADTLTIVSRNRMAIAPPAPTGVPTLPTWGLVALAVLLMSAVLLLQRRSRLMNGGS